MRWLERPFFAGLISLAELLTGRGKYFAYRRSQHVPYLPADEIRAMQWAALTRVLRHAADTVPFYAAMFQSLGATPEDIRNEDDLRRLPILTKDTVRNNLTRLRTTRRLPHAMYLDQTGGSTGQPLAFYQDKGYRRLSGGYMLRSWSWAGWRPGTRFLWIWGAPQETSLQKTLAGQARFFVQRMRMLDAFNMADADLDRWIVILRNFRPEYILGYASALDLLAERIVSSGVAPQGIRAVFSTAEHLSRDQRRNIEGAFGAKVYDGYASREVLTIAHECPRGRMHVLADSVFLETVEDAVGSRLIVTTLNNLAMPLIRYDIGDYGRLSDIRCDCEINFPTMEMDIGRTSDVFVFPNGRRLHGEYFTHLMYGLEGVRSFQFHQKRSDEIWLYVVEDGSRGQDLRAKVEVIVDIIRRASRNTVAVHTDYVDRIPPTPSGKHRFTISDVPR